MIINGRDEEQIQIYESWWYSYVCSSRLWTPLTENKWSIYRIDADSNKRYAVSKITWLPTENYEFIPSQYASLEYSDKIYKTKPTLTFTINWWDLTTSDRNVVIDITTNSYTNIIWYRISEFDKLDLTFVSEKPTSFELSEWVWAKNIYVWIKDNAWNYSDIVTNTIELI